MSSSNRSTSSSSAKHAASPSKTLRRHRIADQGARGGSPRLTPVSVVFGVVVASGALSGCYAPSEPVPNPSPIYPATSSSATTKPAAPPLQTAQELTVRIENVTCGAAVHVGSGFLISPDYAVTAYHVVEGAREPLAVRPSFAQSDSSISSGTVVAGTPRTTWRCST